MARPLRNYNKSNFKENVNPTKMKKIAILWLAAMLAGCSTTPRVVADVTIRPGDGSVIILLLSLQKEEL